MWELRRVAQFGGFCCKLLRVGRLSYSRSLAKLDWELFKKDVLCTKVTPFTKGLTFYKRTHF